LIAWIGSSYSEEEQRAMIFQEHKTNLPILLLPMHPKNITKIKLVIAGQN